MGTGMDGKIIGIVIMLIITIYLMVCCNSISVESKIRNHEVIVIDNTEYNTDDIVTIDVEWREYQDSIVTISFKDGTEITTSHYTLKNRSGN